jgi:hypothetical protein
MTTKATITKIASAIAFASLAATFAGSPAHAGWGSNGQYGNAPQSGIGPHFGGNGGVSRPGYGGTPRPGYGPAVRPAWVPGQGHVTGQIYPRPMPPVVYPRPVSVIYPRPAPPIYVPTPVVVKQPVYVPTPVVVKQPVYIRPAPVVVASAPAPVVAAPVVNNTCNCLVKEYPQAGVVVFKDICTKETATYSNLPVQTSEVVPAPVQ